MIEVFLCCFVKNNMVKVYMDGDLYWMVGFFVFVEYFLYSFLFV